MNKKSKQIVQSNYLTYKNTHIRKHINVHNIFTFLYLIQYIHNFAPLLNEQVRLLLVVH